MAKPLYYSVQLELFCRGSCLGMSSILRVFHVFDLILTLYFIFTKNHRYEIKHVKHP